MCDSGFSSNLAWRFRAAEDWNGESTPIMGGVPGKPKELCECVSCLKRDESLVVSLSTMYNKMDSIHSKSDGKIKHA